MSLIDFFATDPTEDTEKWFFIFREISWFPWLLFTRNPKSEIRNPKSEIYFSLVNT